MFQLMKTFGVDPGPAGDIVTDIWPENICIFPQEELESVAGDRLVLACY